MSSNSTQHDKRRAPSVQPDDGERLEDVIDRQQSKRALKRLDEDNREIEARVRQLLDEADRALVGDSAYDAGDLLETVHWFIINDERTQRLLDPADDRLDAATKAWFERHIRARARGTQPPASDEFKVLYRVAVALEYTYAYGDSSRYIPVKMESLDIPGAKSTPTDAVTPVGRRRLSKTQTRDETEDVVRINHEDCEHVLVIALPRKGKDSTIVNLAGNLKDQHGYKWFSCLDDGRNETPMIGIENDEAAILENLEQLNQSPKAYQNRVYVPDTSGVPDVLPENYHPFTLGIDTLTPRLILRLAGITTDDSNTMRRIGQALEEAKLDGGVEKLVTLLNEYADTVEATITVTELIDDEFESDGDHAVVADATQVEEDYSVREFTTTMDADDVLEECAQSLMMLAGEGLIADAGAPTNLDIQAELAAQDRVAILNCNFLEPRNEALKYIILNLWLRLIFRARDENSRLPRALLEIRELKDICPSVMANAKFNKEVKALRNTIYEIATRGGSRRILMLGSTQKLNDVYKAVRTNMPVKILLQLGEEEIMTLDRSYDFSPREQEQLTGFDPGWGMLITDGDKHYPIQWRGARCGLGLGDEHWRDRYGKAWGARVRSGLRDGWKSAHRDKEAYVNARSGYVKPVDVANDKLPDLGEWHLLLEDLRRHVPATLAFDDLGPGDRIDRQLIDATLEARREVDIPTSLALRKTDRQTERTLSFASEDEEREIRKRQILTQENVPKCLEGWLGANKREMREKMLTLLREIRNDEDGDLTSHAKIQDASGIPTGTVNRYLSDDSHLGRCVTKNGSYKLTAIGKRALKIDWNDLDQFF